MTRSETKKKLGPCMNVFLNFDPYTTLDLFHPKQWLQKWSNIKEIETWKVTNRLWNGKMIKNDQCWKGTQFYGLRTKRMQIRSYGNFWAKRGKQQEKRINTREKQFQLKLVKWSKKNANSSSHLRKINEKSKTKARTPHTPLLDAVTREIITALAVICAQNQWYNTLKEI